MEVQVIGRYQVPLINIASADLSLVTQTALTLSSNGTRHVVLSVDDDGYLMSLLSPRRSNMSVEKALEIIESIWDVLRTQFEICGLALTVEELCPGGMDPTQGIQIAQRLAAKGADYIIASGGTEALPALKWRRPTRLKPETEDLSKTFPWMASAAWLVGRVTCPIWAQGSFTDIEAAREKACLLGLSGIVNERQEDDFLNKDLN